ncbi:YdiU family protein [Williamsia sp. CHRR-6]|uniref:protein adenylyltransferase SelO n=1 Tax=Williamsia sp. CHRR-6 TaxID=2835871 RepID=UPI001BDAB3EB|nr:YdiU family protein [Williamsia sp. CHRR-6]MBT0567546.1 YdiU family protein [Williamsia sp. CHRR-6]
MTTAFRLENTFARDLEGLFVPSAGEPAPDPQVVVLNTTLATELGLDPDAVGTRAGAEVLTGARAPEGSTPIAMAYAGHQFGGYQPLLGDGRALLLGELIDTDGNRRDLHLKGSGATRFSRGGDGRAALGPMLREYLISEAMHALGIPTTRALAVTATGEAVQRDAQEPGAVLARVAASHIRVGTFEFAVRQRDPLARLADYAIARHYPQLVDSEPAEKYVRFFDAVVDRQAHLVAQWMSVGFIHGVLNTDNTTISGETIDYGPCAFLDAHDPATVFSSIDINGRYAYGAQPVIIGWNLSRFAETLIPLVAAARGDDVQSAVQALTAVLETYLDRYSTAHHRLLRAKIGVPEHPAADQLADDLLALMTEHRADHTATFRALADELRGDPAALNAVIPRESSAAWVARWRELPAGDPVQVAAAMDAVNPIYIPRNHLVDAALTAATAGDLQPFNDLLAALTRPFDADPALSAYAAAAPPEFADRFQTFCGT